MKEDFGKSRDSDKGQLVEPQKEHSSADVKIRTLVHLANKCYFRDRILKAYTNYNERN